MHLANVLTRLHSADSLYVVGNLGINCYVFDNTRITRPSLIMKHLCKYYNIDYWFLFNVHVPTTYYNSYGWLKP